MTLFMAFAVTLVVAVLLSGLAEKTILSVSVLFLASGFLLGSGIFGHVRPVNPDLLQRIAELALFSVVFTDGMKTGGIQEIRGFWKLPAAALLIGMPLTIAGIALLARFMVGLTWPLAFLLGAALSPTDPVFVSAIFQFEHVPEIVKRVLNVESGLNDGLSLPAVLLLLAYVTAHGATPGATAGKLALGVAIGVVIPWAEVRLENTKLFHASGLFHPLNAFALGVLVIATCYVTGANLFLAGFAAGIGLATFGHAFTESFREFGELVTELLKLAALLLFGAAIAPQFFKELPPIQYVFIVLAVFAVRPLAILVSMIHSGLSLKNTLVTGWFGPKGFASVVYGLIIYESGFIRVAHLIALAVTASILVYSSTDILVGRWFQPHDRPVAQPSTADSRAENTEQRPPA